MKEKLAHLSIVAIFAALFYSNSFGNFFVWNDWTLIIENFLVHDWRNLPEIFSSAFWKPLVGEPPQIYRPLVSLSFMADFFLWALKPWGYHLTNISLHVLNSILVYFLLRIYAAPTVALMGSVLFAVHPIHTEAVTYISGRGELLMSFFLLSGTLLFLKSEKKQSWPLYLASLPVFFLALLAKETAVIFPLLLLATDITALPHAWQSNVLGRLSRLIGPLVTLGLYLLLREVFVVMTSDYSATAPGFVHHLLLTLKAFPLYLGLLLLPFNLHYLHPLGPFSLSDFQLPLSVVLLLGSGWALGYAIREGHYAVAFALLWFFLALLPLVHFTASGAPLLEGWLYLPSLGFFLIVAQGLSRLESWSPSRVHLWLTLLIAALLGAITFSRNGDWQDELQISLHTFNASPNDSVALRLLGDAEFRHGRTLEGEKMVRKALLLAPRDPRAHESLGRIESFFGRDSEALAHYQRMRELTPKETFPYWWIGRYYLRRRNFAEAEKYLSKATSLFPNSSELRNDLAQAYYLQGKLETSRAELEAALRVLPNSPILRFNLEQLLRQKR